MNLSKENDNEFIMRKEQFQNEFDFIIAQQILKKALMDKLISVDEFNKISALNAKKFSPELTSIMPTNT